MIDDCDLVKDNLHLDFNKIAFKPECISQIRLVLMDSPRPNHHDYNISGKTATNITNPVKGKNRCVTTNIRARVTFLLPNEQTLIEKMEYELNPLADKCLKSTRTEYTRTDNQMTVDIAEAIPVKLWEICIFSVSYGSHVHDIKEPIPRRSIFVDFTTKVCKEEKHEVFYKFRGRNITITKIFSFKDVRSLGRGLQVIRDCDILEDQFKININQMISKPECNTRTYVKVAKVPYASYTEGVGNPNELRDNPLKNSSQQCFEQSVTVAAMVERNKWLSTQHFKLDPMKCFNADAELKLKEGDKQGGRRCAKARKVFVEQFRLRRKF